jgi:pimeloyl-ACP methyl ester carboxylesterase
VPHLPVSDGAQLYYEVTGIGPALVFAHGLGGNHMSWWQQVPAFSDRYTCVTFSHRGFHPSTGAADPERFTDDLAALVDHLKFADVALVAQSMGGWTCLEYTLRQPERVRALVMAETTGPLSVETLDREGMEARTAALFDRGIHPAAGERMAREQPALHHLYRLIDGLSSGVDKRALRARLGGSRSRPAATMSGLRVPILWLFGDESYIGPEAADWVRRTFPSARVERVPETGHSIYFQRPELFNRVVGGFLDG